MFTHILSKREKKTAIIKKIKFDELGSLYKGAFVFRRKMTEGEITKV